MPSILRHFIWPVILLPVFFVLNGFRDNYPLVTIGGALIILTRYICISALLFGLAWLFFKDARKAALTACALISIQFFFGSLHDTLKDAFGDSFFTRYAVVIPCLFALFIAFVIRLRRKQWQPVKLLAYVNILLFLFIAFELVILLTTAEKIRKQQLLKGKVDFTACTDCSRPDIYFIVADGYPGNEVLDSVFHFSNAAFTDTLRNRGFHIIPRSLSNYNFTMFSIASMLNLDYLEGIKGDYREQDDIKRCFRATRENRLWEFLRGQGYDFYNHSLFDFRGYPSHAGETFIPRAQQLITSQTLSRRVDRDLAFHLYSSLQLEKRGQEIMFRHDNTTREMVRMTEATTRQQSERPKFVYTHLLMPHFPYYYDSSGKPYDWRTVLHFNHDKTRFIQYLHYTNRKLSGLIDSILASSKNPPVIIFASDHGFRQYGKKVPTRLLCSNFNAVLLPGRDYSRFYNGMSAVNSFRAVLNTTFKQDLPMLKDSSIFIIDSEVE